MRLPSRREYPKSIRVKDTDYAIKFKRRIQAPDGDAAVGLFDPSEHIISLKIGQTVGELYYTFIHEVVHAFEVEYDIKLAHKDVERLEKAIGDFLLVNF